ncbi:MAG: zinc ribbon-containing protein [Gammaproteobacteria bacterium]
MTGPGTLGCQQCDEEIEFKTTSVIPDCPKCGAKIFYRC